MPLDSKIFRIVTGGEFSATPIPDLDCLYDLAIPATPENLWGDRTEHARALLVAHMLTVSESGGSAAGPVEREKVAQLEREYAVNADSDSTYMMTSYGREFLRLRSALVKTPLFTVC